MVAGLRSKVAVDGSEGAQMVSKATTPFSGVVQASALRIHARGALGIVIVLLALSMYLPEPHSLGMPLKRISRRSLVPTYASFLGGTSVDIPFGIAVDQAGAVYVAGYTDSDDFPTTPGVIQRESNGDLDAFIAKIDPSGERVIYATFLGGSGTDIAWDVGVDSEGAAYVVGGTSSPDFAHTPGSYGEPSAQQTAFVSKLTPDGSTLEYSALLGPGRADAVTVNADGDAFVLGQANGDDFPTTPGAFQSQPAGAGDAFVTRLSSDGSALEYSTFYGGTEIEHPADIVLDESGRAYIAGGTVSTDLPTTPGVVQRTLGGEGRLDGFVASFGERGRVLRFGSYLGGSRFEFTSGIGLDARENVYVAGTTKSRDFPTTPQVLQSSKLGGFDFFVSKLGREGSALMYSTYVGGSGDEFVGEGSNELTVTRRGVAVITGQVRSTDFPTTKSAVKRRPGTNDDAVVAKIAPDGSRLRYSTYLGGFDNFEAGRAVASDRRGGVYVIGLTYGQQFPLAQRPFQRTHRGNAETFVAHFSPGRLVRSMLKNDGFSRKQLRVPRGTTVLWSFNNQDGTKHTVRDTSGMRLFGSGRRSRHYKYAFTFFSAGRFIALDVAGRSVQLISVPVSAVRRDAESSRVTWGAARPPAGYAFDVQVKHPGAGSFELWKRSVRRRSGSYVATAGPGTYSFRARLRSVDVGAHSGWSRAQSIRLSPAGED
jgi:hypothetical protein